MPMRYSELAAKGSGPLGAGDFRLADWFGSFPRDCVPLQTDEQVNVKDRCQKR
jgi:hypothetical protein